MFAALVALAWWSYRPGLHGGFLFDDFVNLTALGEYGAIRDWPAFLRYITSGTADPTGRPLALLTFLIDARDWPASPAPFLRTNVWLHLLNGVLLFALLSCLGRVMRYPALQAAFGAVLGAGLWMLHPLMVSTALYVVQREAMLPGTFVLLGLLGYTWGRKVLSQGDFRGLVLAAVAIVVCTTLATLSKANGALLPAFTWLLEWVLLSRILPVEREHRRRFAAVKWVCLILPSMILAVYLAGILWNGFIYGAPAHRPWTLGERMLTESRIVFDYLRLLWLPTASTPGLFHDDYRVSESLLSPWTTAVAICGLTGVLAAGVSLRRRVPTVSMAILFFMLGHVMESGVLLLELYYEHRNYVPAMFMFWPLGIWLAGHLQGALGAPQGLPRGAALTRFAALLLVVVLPLGLAALTWSRASLWGNQYLQAKAWADLSPNSPRAQAYAAQVEMAHDEFLPAIVRLERLLQEKPDEIQLALNLVAAKCAMGSLAAQDIEDTKYALRTTRILQRIGYEWFEKALANPDTCPQMDLNVLASMVEAARQNPAASRVPARKQDLLSIQGRIALASKDPDSALAYFNQALDLEPRPGVAYSQAAALGRAGAPQHGLDHLDHYEQHRADLRPSVSDMRGIHSLVLEKQGYWRNEGQHLRTILRADRDARN